MAESKELKQIKKKYGEDFMKLCREMFPAILEQEGLLYQTLTSKFAGNSRTLYKDIVDNGLEEEFKSYVYESVDVEKGTLIEEDTRTPYEILEEAGYDLYECRTEEEIQEFKRYYAEGEELCTFRGGRLDRCVVFWAVKKDVENIKREDFKSPKREDEYGTSVMSIQFEKHGICTVSIKNRYNSTVNNPDATFGNDLDRIAPGLSQSFARLLKERGLNLNTSNIEKFEIPGYVVANDGKYYKYNQEINGIYYCPGNIVIEGGEAKKIGNPESQILIDYFILDLKNKTIYKYDNKDDEKDSFVDGFEDIEKMEIKKNPETKTRIITISIKDQKELIIIEIDNDNRIVRYENNLITECGDNFLSYNKALKEISMRRLKKCGHGFLYGNKDLREILLPELEQCGSQFLLGNRDLREISLPKLEKCGDVFLLNNGALREISMPELRECGYGFLRYNKALREMSLPKLEKCGDDFLCHNEDLREISMPRLKKCGHGFLYDNEDLREILLPELEQCGSQFLLGNRDLREISLPKLEKCGYGFLRYNKALTEISLPKLEKCGDDFLRHNEDLREISMPELRECGGYFLYSNQALREMSLPKLEKCGDGFLLNNRALREISMPELEQCGSQFLLGNRDLREISLPKLEKCGDDFLCHNEDLREISMPELRECGGYFLYSNQALREMSLPELRECGDCFLKWNKALREMSLPKLERCGYDFLMNNQALREMSLPELRECGDCFLKWNKALRKISLPKLEKHGYGFLENNVNIKHINKLGNIIPRDIARLDRKCEITTSEVNGIRGIIRSIVDKFRNRNTNRDSEEEK